MILYSTMGFDAMLMQAITVSRSTLSCGNDIESIKEHA